MKNKLLKISVILIIIFIIILGVRFLSGEDDWICENGQWIKHGNPSALMPTTGCGNNQEGSIEYNNTQYGFSFFLPISWKGYSVVVENWEGNTVDQVQNIKGPEIIIRHPLWTSSNVRQDIPIMIFTLAQWDLIVQEKLSLGAAPIGPSELGRNDKYIFALPARYNFAFPTGFEEVNKIIESKPLRAL